MLEMTIEARKASIAPGLQVRRILPFRLRRMVGPFIFMDHGGPVASMPSNIKSIDVLPHPHIGLSTVSYLFNGKITHRDSLGVEQVIQPGEVNWMTAGKGIAHSERFEDPNLWTAGGFEMIQTWVALPEKVEESDPTFVNYKKDELPVSNEKGVWMRLIAGNAFGLSNHVKVHSPMFYLHVVLDKDARLGLPKGHEERAVYVVKGSIEFEGRQYGEGQMLVFKRSSDPAIKALQSSALMFLGGEPLGERFIWWNFVSSRKERIEQAKADWQQGRIPLPPKDNKEFIPLPQNSGKPASSAPPPEPLS
ncbi:MAG: pirin family protein [Chitinophagaceae bacterium]